MRWIPRLRFRTRTLCFALVTASLACAWVGRHLRIVQLERQVLAELPGTVSISAPDSPQPPANALTVFA